MSELISAYVGEDGEVLDIISDDSDSDLGDGTMAESSAAQRVILEGDILAAPPSEQIPDSQVMEVLMNAEDSSSDEAHFNRKLPETHTLRKTTGRNICVVPRKRRKSSIQLTDDALIHDRVCSDTMAYRCVVCKKQFSNQALLDIHGSVHKGAEKFQCNICFTEFGQSNQLYTHLQKVHDKGYVSLLIRGSDANLHKQSSSDDGDHTQSNIGIEGQKRSSFVDESNKQSRIDNVKSNDNSLGDNRMDSVEADSTPQVADLRVRGVSTRSRAKKEKRSEEDIYQLCTKQVPLSTSAVREFQCEMCAESFFHPSALMDHKRSHLASDAVKCSYPGCTKVFNSTTALGLHVLKHTSKKPFECELCGKRFQLGPHLRRHERTHTGEQPFQCSECDLRFSSQKFLTKHKRTHREAALDVKCHFPGCNREFQSISSLGLHMSIHTGEKPFHCIICGRKFRLAGDLKKHRLIHSGERPFQCRECNATFTQSSHLSTHKKNHCHYNSAQVFKHKGKGDISYTRMIELQLIPGLLDQVQEEGVFMCSGTSCNIVYVRKSDLIEHMKTHQLSKNVQLRNCYKTFVEKRSGVYEELSHTCTRCSHVFFDDLTKRCHNCDGWNYLCFYCEKMFKNLNLLKVHQSVHTDIHPHQCPVCDERIQNAMKLCKHIRQHNDIFAQQKAQESEKLARQMMKAHIQRNAQDKTDDQVDILIEEG